MSRPIPLIIAGLTALSVAFVAARAPTDLRAEDSAKPVLVNTCLITENVNRLVAFYESVLNSKAKRSGDDYAEFPTDGGVLAIFAAGAQEKYIPGSAEPGSNKSVIVEFR